MVATKESTSECYRCAVATRCVCLPRALALDARVGWRWRRSILPPFNLWGWDGAVETAVKQGGIYIARRRRSRRRAEEEAHRPPSSDRQRSGQAGRGTEGSLSPAGNAVAMMEIMLLAGLFAILLAKKGKGRRRGFRRYIRGAMDERLNLGTLATLDVVLASFDQSVNERTFISSIVARWSITEWTAAAGVGPVLVGVCHGDYTAVEVEEWIESSGTWDEGNLVQQEVGKRKIRMVGTFEHTGAAGAIDGAVLNEGSPIRTKCGWILNQGVTLNLWAYNLGTASFATTDPLIVAAGHANLWPR